MEKYSLILLYFLTYISCLHGMRIKENDPEHIDDLALERKLFDIQHFDPAPFTRVRRKVPEDYSVQVQAQFVYPTQQPAHANTFYQKADPISVRPARRPEVSSRQNSRLQRFAVQKNKGYVPQKRALRSSQRKHRAMPVSSSETLIATSPAPTVNALPLSVVQQLVDSIKTANKYKVEDIVKDIQNKLDLIKNMEAGGKTGLREGVSETDTRAISHRLKTTQKPAPPQPPTSKDTMVEMDNIMEDFLRGGLNGTSSSSEGSLTVEDKKQSKRGAGMRNIDSGEELIYDLDGDNAGLRIEWPEQ